MSASKKCRLCLKPSIAYLSLFKENYRQIIQELTSLRITETDGFPQVACIGCIYEIQQAFKAKKRILECHKKLMLLKTLGESVESLDETPVDNADHHIGAEKIYSHNAPTQFPQQIPGYILSQKNNDKIQLGPIYIVKQVGTVAPQAQVIQVPAQKSIVTRILPKQNELRIKNDNHPKSFQDLFNDPELSLEQKKDEVPVQKSILKRIIPRQGELRIVSHVKSLNFAPHLPLDQRKVVPVKIRNPLDSHITDKSRVCVFCGAQFSDNPKLIMHIHGVHRFTLFECGICPNIYFSKSKFKEHKERVHQVFEKKMEVEPTSHPAEIPSHQSKCSTVSEEQMEVKSTSCPAETPSCQSKCSTDKPKASYTCKFPNCKNRFHSGWKLTKKFHMFPRDPHRAKVWRRICNIPPTLSTRNFRVCQDHFYLSDYDNPVTPVRLKFTAIPKPTNTIKTNEDHCYTPSLFS